eukprot:CAMPEP_0197309256 /NCGR_PEP_ID=MMETSP0891-20130614/7816_1 /TAXON_ID=44058 ORGANISM="Aureoumbra lagunensis, Strain CCMP1510" /NCGR_SAMPLE_ID=MMETSP0891 /ASSEMBLY_ACC=CAM_ASM_000534 /LENGTH=361 /DNA_ID=CAMNT_0042794213 /DNA_START=25 /DNA_END=1110 /DNA_ORIENTATION=-
MNSHSHRRSRSSFDTEMSIDSDVEPQIDDVQRLVILDWDDTCCPSSWAQASQEKLKNGLEEEEETVLAGIENGILGVLNAAEALGCYVVIITNADEEWVRFSCTRFLRRVAPIIQRLRVVSARQYEGLYPGRSVCWKAAAFTHVAKAYFNSGNHQNATTKIKSNNAIDKVKLREIISIGDSNDERLAARAAAAPLGATPKAIKLVDSPRLHTVAAQLDTIAKCLPFISNAQHAIDIDIAAVLNYMAMKNLNHSKQNEHPLSILNPTSSEKQFFDTIWNHAAYGLFNAIHFQGLEYAMATSSASTMTQSSRLRSCSSAVDLRTNIMNTNGSPTAVSTAATKVNTNKSALPSLSVGPLLSSAA